MNDTDPGPAIPRRAGIIGVIAIPGGRIGRDLRLPPSGGGE